MIPVVVALFFAAGIFAFGYWGKQNAAQLVPPSLSKAAREKREHQMRRNAVIMQFSAGFLVLLVVVSIAVNLVRS